MICAFVVEENIILKILLHHAYHEFFNGPSQSQFEHVLMFLNIFYIKSFKNVINFRNENRNHVSIL
jgi:hypothetical protein